MDLEHDVLFEKARTQFWALCVRYHLPLPEVKPAKATDRCDFTSPPEVRLNIAAWMRDAPDRTCLCYVAHNFGHYICGLEEDGEDELSNKVADMIGQLVLKDG